MSLSFSAVVLRDYAQSRGWVVVPEALADGLFVMNHAGEAREQLVFAKDETAPDYERSLQMATQILGEIERVSAAEIVARLARVGGDTLEFRLWGNGIESAKLPLTFAAEALDGAKTLLLAAAHSVLSPQFYHPRLSRREAVEFVEAATFSYAMPRSFVFNVSCPLDSVVGAHRWAPALGQGPFARIVTLTTKTALEQLVDVIESDDIGVLKNGPAAATGPLVSSNFCAALLEFQDQNIKNALDVEFAWSPEIAVEPEVRRRATVRLQKSYFGRVEELQRDLRAQEREQKDVFVGRVDRLNGDPGADGRRFGEVTLNLLLAEDDLVVKARTLLSADLYAQAVRAHTVSGSFVLITGRLSGGRQPRTLEFENESDVEFHIADETPPSAPTRAPTSFERPKRQIRLQDD